MLIKLRVLSPDGLIKEEDREYIPLETETGSFGVMRGHVPAAVKLKNGGFARVLPDSVTVFTRSK